MPKQHRSHTSAPIKTLRLRQLFFIKSPQWLLAWTIGLITLFATVGLLSVSGWFISAAALAGLVTAAHAISFDFFRPAAVIRAFAITRTAGRYGERLASHHAVLGLLTELRCLFFNAITQHKLGAVNRMVGSADTLQRLTHDIDQLDELPLRVWAPWLWAVALQLVLLACIAYFSQPLVSVVALPLLLAGMVVPCVGVILGKRIAHKHTQLAEARRRDLLNPLTVSTSLILWDKWQHFQNRFHTRDAQYNALHERERLWGMVFTAIQQMLLAVVLVLLIWQGHPLVAAGELSVPLLLAYVLAVMGLYEIVLPLGSSYTSLGFALASRDRLNALLEASQHATTSSSEATQLQAFPTGHFALTAQDVSTRFPNALTGVSQTHFTLLSGEVLFVKGRSGAGKSTLLHALSGELPIASGTLTVNDTPLEALNMADEVGFLAQRIDIFDLTLAENLRVGKTDATDDELWQVLEKVKLASWAKQQPQQLKTPLGEYGTAVSGGQARRIALARLLLKPRAILLLDEPFAGLDTDSAAHVFAALKDQQKQGILIVVSHHATVPEGVKLLTI